MAVFGAVIDDAVRSKLRSQGIMNETYIDEKINQTKRAVAEKLEKQDDVTMYELLSNLVGNDTILPRTAKLQTAPFIPMYDDEPEPENYYDTERQTSSGKKEVRMGPASIDCRCEKLVSLNDFMEVLDEHAEIERWIELICMISFLIILAIILCLYNYCCKRNQTYETVPNNTFRNCRTFTRTEMPPRDFQGFSNQNRNFETVELH